ncbi:MAG: hypothetical protein WC360_04355 [Opitutales bacterium]
MDDETDRQAIERRDGPITVHSSEAGRIDRPASDGKLNPQTPASVHTKAYPKLEHRFETQLIDEASMASGERESYSAILKEHALLESMSFTTATNNSVNAIMFFNQSRQLVHANLAALAMIRIECVEDAIGLRFGEALGCDHKMSDKPGEQEYHCQNCNCMPSLVAALDGKASREMRNLVMHPGESTEMQTYTVSSVPITAGKGHFAMLVLERA